jgi:hypothetical protein
MVFEIVRPGVAPANAEEERSFAEIRDYCRVNHISVPVICNDVEGHPEHAANDIRDHVLRRYGSLAA